MLSQFTDLSRIPLGTKIPDKAIGVWTIPKLQISVPVYSWKLNPGNPQKITDDPDSACWQPYCNAYIISDHAGSNGVWLMEKITLDTDAYFVKPTGTVKYSCYALYRADYHSWGYTQNGAVVVPRSSKDILCASCVDSSGKEAYLAVFKEVGRV